MLHFVNYKKTIVFSQKYIFQYFNSNKLYLLQIKKIYIFVLTASAVLLLCGNKFDTNLIIFSSVNYLENV